MMFIIPILFYCIAFRATKKFFYLKLLLFYLKYLMTEEIKSYRCLILKYLNAYRKSYYLFLNDKGDQVTTKYLTLVNLTRGQIVESP